jgi:hypothetical protein
MISKGEKNSPLSEFVLFETRGELALYKVPAQAALESIYPAWQRVHTRRGEPHGWKTRGLC